MLQWINSKKRNIQKTVTISNILLVIVFCIFFVLSSSVDVYAQEVTSIADPNSKLLQGVQIIEEPLGLPSTDIRLIIANVIRVALGLVGIVLLVIIIYAGFLWMTAGGNEDQIGKSKKILVNAVIGLAIMLSAYAIVFFVMRMLGISAGSGTGVGATIGEPGVQNFRGSGGLGQVIQDHYPSRNQIDVPRNTKIIVTFSKPIKLEELATDTNGTGIIGDCKTPINNWDQDCDSLILDDDLINISRIVSSSTSPGIFELEPIRGAALLATETIDPVSGISGIYTIVIRPYEYLGSEVEDVSYKVHLGNGIKRDDVELGNPGIFEGVSGSKFYEWLFTCSTDLDLSPPYVIDVYPAQDKIEYRNTVIQISFNEPMDPIGLQGIFIDSSNDYYFLQNGFIYLKSENSTIPLGGFNLVNNYRTLEFTPSVPCGTNACGGTIYCMPVCDIVGKNCDTDNYNLIIKAAATISENTFESQPFTGAADICGNALDGNNDGKIDAAPNTEPVFDTQKVPDNYFWDFDLVDDMDLTSPIISKVVPGPLSPWVDSDQIWGMWFNERMRIQPMYSISIDETPTPQERCNCFTRDKTIDSATGLPKNTCIPIDSKRCVLDSLWKVPSITFNEDEPVTYVEMQHGLFLDDRVQGYIPFVSSAVEDTHFNCLYPGQGPVEGVYATDKMSNYCDGNPENCCIQNNTLVFCCNGNAAENSIEKCRDSLLISDI